MSTVSSSNQLSYNLINQDIDAAHLSSDATTAVITSLQSLLKEVNTHAAESSGKAAFSEKEKKSADDLVKGLIDAVQKASSGKPEESKSLFEMFALLLAALQESSSEETWANLATSLGNGLISNVSSKASQHEMKHVDHEIYKQEHMSKIARFFRGILKIVLPVVIGIAAALTGNVPLLVADITTVIITQTPVGKDIFNGIKSGLEGLGVKAPVSTLLAGVLSAVVIVGAIVATGGLASLEMVSEEGSELGADEGTEVTKKLTLNKKRLKGISLMGSSVALGSQAGNISEGVGGLFAKGSTLQKVFQDITEAILTLISIVGGIAGGAVTISADVEGGSTAIGEMVGNVMKDKMPKIMEFMSENGPRLQRYARSMMYASQGAKASVDASLGTIDYFQSKDTQKLGDDKADLSVLNMNSQVAQTAERQSSQSLQALSNQFREMIGDISNFSSDYEALSVALLSQ